MHIRKPTHHGGPTTEQGREPWAFYHALNLIPRRESSSASPPFMGGLLLRRGREPWAAYQALNLFPLRHIRGREPWSAHHALNLVPRRLTKVHVAQHGHNGQAVV